MHLLPPLLAALSTTPFEQELPLQVTPIESLDVDAAQHAEVLQVVRDFGRPEVNIAVDAWIPAGDAARIDAVRLWWSDDVDRFPFNDRVLRHLVIDYRRVQPDRWKIRVAGDGMDLSFVVALHDGRPALFADVVRDDGRVVKACRTESALLLARRFLGIPIGLDAMLVRCSGPDGTTHRGRLQLQKPKRPSPRRRPR